MLLSKLAILTEAYMEPHRKYHTLDHITRMFNTARDHKLTLTDEQYIAIWFHDFIYWPQSQVNEEMSAQYCVEFLQDHPSFNNYIVEISSSTVARIITDTKDHIATHPQSGLVIDLDLAGLADPFFKYMETGKLIREEYSHLSDEQWAEGRIKFINKFLGRKQIFQTAWGLDHFERKAFGNLTTELEIWR